ncbi:MAG: type VI secretion system contractile sheath small subunit [Gammaproteobacteria bacterium]|nr:type VI secretion system contractile sheath small subunit [Gammaproteobacteria bacterium]
MTHARVNITLDVETHGARRKKELPLKLLVLGNFSRRQNQKPITQLERLNITPQNLDDTLHSLSPTLHLSEGNLTFTKMKDFLPANVIAQIPALRKLTSMRNLLKELKANVLDNPDFRKSLEKISQHKPTLQQLQHEIQQKSSLNGEQ